MGKGITEELSHSPLKAEKGERSRGALGVVVATGQIAAMMLPWAKAHHPEKYADTVKVSNRPAVFRRYLLRLLEIRCREEEGFMGTVPVSVLDETALTVKVRDRSTGAVLEVKGERAEGPQVTRFWELAMEPEDFRTLQSAKQILDLEHVGKITGGQDER